MCPIVLWQFLMQQVVLQGLASRPDLNGKSGVVVEFDAAIGRYRVALDHSDEGVKVLPEKMQLLTTAVERAGSSTALEGAGTRGTLGSTSPTRSTGTGGIRRVWYLFCHFPAC